MNVDTEFLDAVASKRPTPGGGGACACCGALAASLSQMVGSLTVGKPAYAHVQDDVLDALTSLSAHRARLLELVDEDARAFKPLSAAYKMAHGTKEEREEREARVQMALVAACEVPLRIMEECGQVIHLCGVMAQKGTHMALPDAGAAALMAEAAMHGASLDVFINAHAMSDRALADRMTGRADDIAASVRGKAQGIYDQVMEEVR